jgi:hypothetical protein
LFAIEGVLSFSLLSTVESDTSPERISLLDPDEYCTMLSGTVRLPMGRVGLAVGRVRSLWNRITPSLVRR